MKAYADFAGNLLIGIVLGVLVAPYVPDIDGFDLPIPIVTSEHPGSFVWIIEESTETSASVARIKATDYRAQLAARGLQFRLYDIDQIRSTKPNAAKRAEEVGLPAVIILDPNQTGPKRELYAGNCPPTVEALDTVVRKATGL